MVNRTDGSDEDAEPTYRVVWLYNAHARPRERKLWVEYPVSLADYLEQQLLFGRPQCHIHINGEEYTVDLDTMTQRNAKNVVCRQIFRRRMPIPQRMPVPQHVTSSTRLVRHFPPGYCQRLTFVAVDELNIPEYTRQTRIYARDGAYEKDAEDTITLEPLGSGDDDNPVVKLECGCVFLRAGIEMALTANPKCPTCGHVYRMPGAQPSGTMTIREKLFSCEGAEGFATVVITYGFDDGKQNSRMWRPGNDYSGTQRMVVIPSDIRVAETLELLTSAFQNGYAFMVGDSVTTGQHDTVIWRIHQKTATSGGAAKHGWPDAGYLQRLTAECLNYGLGELA